MRLRILHSDRWQVIGLAAFLSMICSASMVGRGFEIEGFWVGHELSELATAPAAGWWYSFRREDLLDSIDKQLGMPRELQGPSAPGDPLSLSLPKVYLDRGTRVSSAAGESNCATCCIRELRILDCTGVSLGLLGQAEPIAQLFRDGQKCAVIVTPRHPMRHSQLMDPAILQPYSSILHEEAASARLGWSARA